MFGSLNADECSLRYAEYTGWLVALRSLKMPFAFCQMFSQPSSPEICGAFRISNRRALAGFRIDTAARIEKRYSPLAVEHIMVRRRHNLGLALLLATGLCLAVGESQAQTAAPPSATPAAGAHPQKTHVHGKKAAPEAEAPKSPPAPLTMEQMSPSQPPVTDQKGM